jgi:hypothetical protein
MLVIALATIVNVGYGAIFCAFSVLLGEDAAAREFSRTVRGSPFCSAPQPRSRTVSASVPAGNNPFRR